MQFRQNFTDDRFHEWLSAAPTEDELREAYLVLEAKRADLWRPGHVDSFRRDRFERDARYVRQLVLLKSALARQWVITGQVAELAPAVEHPAA
ncbi:MAG: hypothetical protein HYX32_03855 [Actinobacteria bacterium]|nr:hypothetical protein [Actinomycetota bacterium]